MVYKPTICANIKNSKTHYQTGDKALRKFIVWLRFDSGSTKGNCSTELWDCGPYTFNADKLFDASAPQLRDFLPGGALDTFEVGKGWWSPSIIP